MTDGNVLFNGIGDIIGRRHQISGLDPRSGSFALHDAHRTVQVVIDVTLLGEYFEQLDENDVPNLAQSPEGERDRVRAKYVTMQIEEIFESDISRSLLEIRLVRSADGRPALVDRRGPAQRPFPPRSAGGAHWSSDRAGL